MFSLMQGTQQFSETKIASPSQKWRVARAQFSEYKVQGARGNLMGCDEIS